MKGRTKEATRVQAGRLGLKYKNSNKHKYVYKNGNQYMVRFQVNGKYKYFGIYDSEEEAAKVAMQKAKEYGKAI